MLGIMLPTWLLSMWISNTATAAMMLPIAEAVIEQLDIDTRTHSEPADTVASRSRSTSRRETCESRQICRGTSALRVPISYKNCLYIYIYIYIYTDDFFSFRNYSANVMKNKLLRCDL